MNACTAQLALTADALARYLVAVLEDGDYLNDWLTHLPSCSADGVQLAGWLLAALIGA